MKVSVLLPYKSDRGHRDRIFHWTIRRYEALFPDYQVIAVDVPGEAFNRSASINAAARHANGDVFVIADSDLVFRRDLIETAIRTLSEAEFIIPYTYVAHITYDGTADLLRMDPATDEYELMPIEGFRKGSHGGLGVIRRETFERVGGFDERFTGWGCEDDSFLITIRELCGPVGRLDATIYHLWHPPSPHAHTASPLYQANYRHYLRYWQAQGDPDAIEAIIREEGHHAALQDHQPLVQQANGPVRRPAD